MTQNEEYENAIRRLLVATSAVAVAEAKAAAVKQEYAAAEKALLACRERIGAAAFTAARRESVLADLRVLFHCKK